jgi:hypothetical protein
MSLKAVRMEVRFGKAIKPNQARSFFKILNSIHNAVLKFINYITQVAAFTGNALSPSLYFSITLRVILGGMAATSWVIASLRPSKVWGRCWHTWALR